jgi:hypothetical protein
MTTDYVSFADTMGINSAHVPADPGIFDIVALYATGTGGIEATTAEMLRFTRAGVGVVLIDQTPSLSVLAAGIAHVGHLQIGDVEPEAGTILAAAHACLDRQRRGLDTTLYVSQGALNSLLSALHSSSLIDLSLVTFGVADWNLSRSEAESYIDHADDVAYVQWASPSSNPLTIEPGTDMTLKVANVDLNVARADWANKFAIHKYGPFRQELRDTSVADYAKKRGTSVDALLRRSWDHYTAADRKLLGDSHFSGPIAVYTERP